MARPRTVSTGEWAKHLRPYGKRVFAKKERKAGKKQTKIDRSWGAYQSREHARLPGWAD